MVSILLLEDLAIVPLLALVALLAPAAAQAAAGARWLAIGIALAAIAALVAAGRWLLNPMFRMLADAQAREVMTAAALLVVLGAALVMQLGGLSMAMGAFLAGVLLSESTFRHQLEADIEPFRGILLGLFFLGVGMSLDLARDRAQLAADPRRRARPSWSVKAAGIYVVARLFRRSHREALYRARAAGAGRRVRLRALRRGGGASACSTRTRNAILTAIVILSMALTPLGVLALRWLLPRGRAVDGRRRRRRRTCTAACWSSASAASARWRARRCWRAASTSRSSTPTPR